jgi:hypothetical protein
MRQDASKLLVSLSVAALLAAPGVGVSHQGEAHPIETADIEVRLGSSKVSLVDKGDPNKRKMAFKGKWSSGTPDVSPLETASKLRVTDFNGGDSGLIKLPAGNWVALNKDKGFKYVDKTASAGGIKKIVLKKKKSGGKVSIKGGGERWAYTLSGSEGENPVAVTLEIGDYKWCADLTDTKRKATKITAKGKLAPSACPCEEFGSTWEGIRAIFERNSCTTLACHGSSPGQGDLDLRPEVAYENLVSVYSVAGGKNLVQIGSRQDSFLWEKLAAATEGYDLEGRGTPMPSGAPPITEDELEAIRLWIQFGAPETGVVLGTEDVLGACLPPPDAPTIDPPDPPAEGTGVQFHAPPWTIAPAVPNGPSGEGEVCYATYFNVADQIPDEFKTPCPDFWGGPTETCYFYNTTDLTQTPNSHHSIIHMYRGEYDLTWEPGQGDSTSGFQFRCHGGPMEGEICDPRDENVCGGEGECHGAVLTRLACLGYGPPDYGRGANPIAGGGGDNSPSVGGSQQPFVRNVFPSGVFGVFPAEGVIVWNSHAFNLFDTPETNEQWWNIYFAPEMERDFLVQGIFDSTDIFVQEVPPFEEREYCRTVTFPKGTRVFELSSHTHERGRLFRIWGPGIPNSCRSTIDDPDACVAEDTAPIFVTTEYNDPTVLPLKGDKMHVLTSDAAADRRYKFCSIYDNGFTNSEEVKRNSTSPAPPQFGNLAPGGKCYYRGFGGDFVDIGISCMSGPNKGEECLGENALCDSAPSAGDGVCDACPLRGGVTTDDEMFILLGKYFCEPGSDCEAGICVSGPNMGMRCDGDGSVCGNGHRCGPYSN